MSMLKDLFAYVSAQAVAAEAPKPLPVKDPRAVHLFAAGAPFKVEAPPPPRAHKVGSVADLCALADRFAAGGATPAVWYNEDVVVLVIDDGELDHRAERATLELDFSRRFLALRGLEASNEWKNQKDMIRLLRIDLAGCLAPSALLTPLRKVRYETGSAGTADRQHGRESVGREVTSQVHASDSLPEEVFLECPVWSTPGLTKTFAVRCTFEIEPEAGLFRLKPMADDLERVVGLANEHLCGELKNGIGEDVPVYHGAP
jgi:hypothetical protein